MLAQNYVRVYVISSYEGAVSAILLYYLRCYATIISCSNILRHAICCIVSYIILNHIFVVCNVMLRCVVVYFTSC